MAGVESGTAVGGCDDHGHARLADIQMAEAVDHGDGVDVPRLADENADFLELFKAIVS